MRTAVSWRGLVLAVAACAAGCGDATLSELRPGVENSSFICWLTLNLKKLPKGGDPQDIQVKFSSVVLYEDLSFDWEYIAANDYQLVDQKDSLGNDIQKYVLDAGTTAGDPPRPGKMRVKFTLPSKQSVKLESGDKTNVMATLYWGGKKQDSITRGLMMAYQSR
ncbi:MAG TPA: hypothetical protein VND93_02520 [Myxococcales bacterium]|nr:hypothetical protein [Myxococcales bacterium]